MRVTHKRHIKNYFMFVTVWNQLVISSIAMLYDNSLVYTSLWHAVTPVTQIIKSWLNSSLSLCSSMSWISILSDQISGISWMKVAAVRCYLMWSRAQEEWSLHCQYKLLQHQSVSSQQFYILIYCRCRKEDSGKNTKLLNWQMVRSTGSS